MANAYLFCNEIRVYKESEILTVGNAQYEEWSINMESYNIFPGIDLIFNKYYTEISPEADVDWENVMEINYCKKGRYEGIFDENKYVYLAEGEIAYSLLMNKNKISCFPMRYYEGCSILIDCKIANDFLKKNYKDMNIKIDKIKEKLFYLSWYKITRNDLKIKKIFEDIYSIGSREKINFYKLKILELLISLQIYDVKEEMNNYYTEAQIDKIREIRKFITKNYNSKITLKELSKYYNVSASFLQSAFKDIYGKTIAEYIREYRICFAAKMIKETNDSIMQIAMSVGYDNPSKFASAFKKFFGKTPREYRVSQN